MHTLKFPEKISLKQAIDKISVYAMWGEGQNEPRPKSKSEVAKLLVSKNIDPNKFAEKCRDYKEPIPEFENILGPMWNVEIEKGVNGKGGKIQHINIDTGEVINELTESGQITFSNYQEAFLTAAKIKNEAVEESSYSKYYLAVVYGISAIEAYLNYRAEQWNKLHPEKPLEDTKENKVNIEEKITDWIPIMCNGRKIDKGKKKYNYFKELKEIRDNKVIHQKKPGTATAFKELAILIDKFRFGIAMLLGEIHLFFHRAIPACIINAVYYPDVEVIEVTDS